MGTVTGSQAITGYPAEAEGWHSKARVEQTAQGAGFRVAGTDDRAESHCGDVEMKWKYFCGACLVVGAALLKAGAPLFAVLAGIVLAGTWNFWRYRRKPGGAGAAVVRPPVVRSAAGTIARGEVLRIAPPKIGVVYDDVAEPQREGDYHHPQKRTTHRGPPSPPCVLGNFTLNRRDGEFGHFRTSFSQNVGRCWEGNYPA